MRVNTERSGLVPGRFLLVALLASSACGSAGCDRLRVWLSLARGDRQEPTSSVGAGLGAYDCPPGLVRCVEGRVERSIGGSIDALTLERKGCPFDVIDRCEGRCVDDEDHLENELPELCLGDALFRQRHPRVESMQDAAIDDAAAAVDATASAPAPTDLESYER
jgi:hypothetical protein